MVWGALIAGGLSLAGGLLSQQSQSKTAKKQTMQHIATEMANIKAKEEAEKHNKALGARLGKALLKEKLVQTEHTVGGTTRTRVGGSDGGSSTVGSVDYAGMMAAAEAAGFNPKTFLMAGGLQAYTRQDTTSWARDFEQVDERTDLMVTTTSKGHNAVPAYQLMAELGAKGAYQATPAPIAHVPSAGEAVVNGLKAGFNQYNEDRIRTNAQDFQRELLNTQLNAIQQRPPMSRSFYVPGFSTSGSSVTKGTQGGLTAIKPGDRSVTSPFSVRPVDGTVPDADAANSRYGEPGEWLFGISNMIDDGMYSLTGLTKPQRYDRTLQWLKGPGEFFGGIDAKKLKSEPMPSWSIDPTRVPGGVI